MTNEEEEKTLARVESHPSVAHGDLPRPAPPLSAHTPGPWRVELSSNQFEASGYVCKVVGNCDPGPDGLCDDVATVATHYDGPAMFSRVQWEANARLIAAAPELLDALKALATAHKYFGPGESRPKGNGVWAQAWDAIAKAEGR